MRSNISSVAGWLVPARGTCSRKLSSPSVSTNVTGTSSCASASERHKPTGPAPMTTTRSDLLIAAVLPLSCWRRSRLRHDVLGGADPAIVRQVEDDAERIAILRLIIGVRRARPAFKIGPARVDHLLLRRIEIVDPHPEVIEPDLLVPLLLEEGDVDGPVRQVEPPPRLAGPLEIEGGLEEFRGLFRVGHDQRDVAHLGHSICPFVDVVGSACREYSLLPGAHNNSPWLNTRGSSAARCAGARARHSPRPTGTGTRKPAA